MLGPMLESARTFLFVPGDRPERFEKALASGADCVIVDLEDAVAPASKEVARHHVVTWLSQGQSRVLVRINDPASSVGAADLEALAPVADLAVVVPKVSCAADLDVVRRHLGPDALVLPLIETAAGLVDVNQIAQAAGVARLILGHLDLCLELGLSPDDSVLLAPARFAIVVASAAAGLAAPVGGVTTDTRDLAVVAADTRAALSGGFTAKLCAHPAQVAPVHDTFAPDAAEVAWARGVLAAVPDNGVALVDGHLVDRPVLLRAQTVLARASQPVAIE